MQDWSSSNILKMLILLLYNVFEMWPSDSKYPIQVRAFWVLTFCNKKWKIGVAGLVLPLSFHCPEDIAPTPVVRSSTMTDETTLPGRLRWRWCLTSWLSTRITLRLTFRLTLWLSEASECLAVPWDHKADAEFCGLRCRLLSWVFDIQEQLFAQLISSDEFLMNS